MMAECRAKFGSNRTSHTARPLSRHSRSVARSVLAAKSDPKNITSTLAHSIKQLSARLSTKWMAQKKAANLRHGRSHLLERRDVCSRQSIWHRQRAAYP